MKMNNSAQIHVLEVVIVAGMLLLSLYFVRTFEFSPASLIQRENKFEILGDSILASLEGVPSNHENYTNLLAQYVGLLDKTNFTQHVNLTLPDNLFYNITIYNITKMHKFAQPASNCKTNLYGSPVWIGEEVSSSRIVVIKKFIYEVKLDICFTLR